MASEYQKMIAGEPYRPSDPELRALDYQDLVWFDWAKSLCQSTLGGRLWSQYPSRGKFLF